AAALEVGFLYFDALRTAHRISSVCDVELFPESEERSRMAGIMVRAAMELPNPPDRDPYIDPFRKASKLRILIGVLLYKGKVLVTNALAKVLVRKLLLRGVARAWLEFVAVPVTAAWNALVCFWVLRQVRVRAIGPSSVLETLPKLLGGADELVAETSQRAVACCVSASRDLHPNHLYMLEWMRENNGFHVSANIDDDEVFFSCFEALNEESKKVVIEVLAMAVIIDGRVAGREKKFFTSVLGRGPASNEVMSIKQLDTMAHEFRNGKGVVPFLESERS
ncbi:MAG: LBF_2804 family protein, partial [Akkermansiaceae bacterium]